MRIAELLNQKRVPYEYLPHAPAYTAHQLAKYLRVPGEQVAKCVLLRGPSSYLVAILPANYQVDTEGLSQLLNGPVRVADRHEMSEVFQDCEWGVVPAFGGLYGVSTLLEASINPDTPLVMETHTHVEAVRLRCRDFEELEQPRRLPFLRQNKLDSAARGED
jgi:Ala-tRNA(Pro) deacylase